MEEIKKLSILDIMVGLGFLLIISPFIIYWFITSDYERYICIISGSYPFNQLGSGVFQLWLYIALICIGLLLISTSIIIKISTNKT